jgi:hypothetical protein
MWAAIPEEKRLRDGETFIQLVWEQIRDKVIEAAVRVYELSPEQAKALRRAFGKSYLIEAV